MNTNEQRAQLIRDYETGSLTAVELEEQLAAIRESQKNKRASVVIEQCLTSRNGVNRLRRILPVVLFVVVLSSLLAVVLVPSRATLAAEPPDICFVNPAMPDVLLEPKRPTFVSASVFSPDGERIAYATDYGTIRVADCNSVATVKRRLIGHGSRVRTLSWVGDRIASVSLDSRILLWDLGTGAVRVVRDEKGHTGAVMAARLSPDGKMIASIDRLGRVAIWDADGSLLNSFDAYDKADGGGHGERLKWHPTGRLFLTVGGGKLNVAKVWNSAGMLQTTVKQDLMIGSIAWSPDGSSFASSLVEGPVRVWTLAGKKTGEHFHDELKLHLSWMDDSDLLMQGKGTNHVWDTKRDVVRNAAIRCGVQCWSASRKHYAAATADEFEIRRNSGQLVSGVAYFGGVTVTALTMPANSVFPIVACSNGRISQFTDEGERVIRAHGSGIILAKAHPTIPDCALFADKSASVWLWKDQQLTRILRLDSPAYGLVWSRTGRLAAVVTAIGADTDLRVLTFDAIAVTRTQSIPIDGTPWSIDWAPNDRYLVLGMGGLGGIRIVDPQAGSVLEIGKRSKVEVVRRESDVPLREHVNVSISPDGNTLAATSYYGNWATYSLEADRVTDVQKDRIDTTLLLRNGVVDLNYGLEQPAWLDDKTFAVGSSSGSVWHIQPQANDPELTSARLVRHESRITSVAWDASSQRLASADTTGSIRITKIAGPSVETIGYTGELLGLTWTGNTVWSFDRKGFVYCWSGGRLERVDFLGDGAAERFATVGKRYLAFDRLTRNSAQRYLIDSN